MLVRKIFGATQTRILEIFFQSLVCYCRSVSKKMNFDRDNFNIILSNRCSFKLYHRGYMTASLNFLRDGLRIPSWLIVASWGLKYRKKKIFLTLCLIYKFSHSRKIDATYEVVIFLKQKPQTYVSQPVTANTNSSQWLALLQILDPVANQKPYT